MKLKTYTTIFMLLSLMLIFPSIKPDNSVTIIQDTPKSVIINVSTPNIVITADHNFAIFMNLSFVDVKTNSTERITEPGFVFTLETEIEMSKGPGPYLFEFFTSQLSTVEIQYKGMYFELIVAILVLVATNLILYLRDFIWIYGI